MNLKNAFLSTMIATGISLGEADAQTANTTQLAKTSQKNTIQVIENNNKKRDSNCLKKYIINPAQLDTVYNYMSEPYKMNEIDPTYLDKFAKDLDALQSYYGNTENFWRAHAGLICYYFHNPILGRKILKGVEADGGNFIGENLLPIVKTKTRTAELKSLAELKNSKTELKNSETELKNSETELKNAKIELKNSEIELELSKKSLNATKLLKEVITLIPNSEKTTIEDGENLMITLSEKYKQLQQMEQYLDADEKRIYAKVGQVIETLKNQVKKSK
ncbi:MAG TPA: hypothetical protein PKC14_03385 [Candidatus Absconditabacterales bacterium]|nr:hypothetical protein [Candidatus Absconditabacterales bacterium]